MRLQGIAHVVARDCSSHGNTVAVYWQTQSNDLLQLDRPYSEMDRRLLVIAGDAPAMPNGFGVSGRR